MKVVQDRELCVTRILSDHTSDVTHNTATIRALSVLSAYCSVIFNINQDISLTILLPSSGAVFESHESMCSAFSRSSLLTHTSPSASMGMDSVGRCSRGPCLASSHICA